MHQKAAYDCTEDKKGRADDEKVLLWIWMVTTATYLTSHRILEEGSIRSANEWECDWEARRTRYPHCQLGTIVRPRRHVFYLAQDQHILSSILDLPENDMLAVQKVR